MANINFSALKQNRKSQFDKLNNELAKLNQNPAQQSSDDNRFWKPDVDKAGNGYAVVRFLPAPVGEDIPFVRVWSHGFQGPGGWYIENSLTTLGKADPVAEYNNKLWNSGVESNKSIARKQKRNLTYYSNIYVVKDPTRPENEGKVFIFKYGKRIFDKLDEAMNPQFDDEKPINPFDLWEGANFKLKIRNVEGYRNYDKSEFDAPSPLFDTDEDLEKSITNLYSLQEFLDPKNFKSYDDLKARLEKALGIANDSGISKVADDEDEAFPTPSRTAAARPAPVAAAQTQGAAGAPWGDEDEDDELSFFKKLAKD